MLRRFRSHRSRRAAMATAGLALLAGVLAPAAVSADEDDPREGLAPGYIPWSEASKNIDLVDNDPRVAPFDAPPTGFSGIAFVPAGSRSATAQRSRQLPTWPILRRSRRSCLRAIGSQRWTTWTSSCWQNILVVKP